MKVNLPKIITSENSVMATIDPLSFVLHQIDSKSLIEGSTFIMKLFDSIMAGQLNQVTDNSRPSNAIK